MVRKPRHLYKNHFKYFVCVPRKKGFFGFKTEYPLLFPDECANCGSPNIDERMQIGIPEINIHHNIGKVPYCKTHISPIKDYKTYIRSVLYPTIFFIMIITFYGLQKKIPLGQISELLYLGSILMGTSLSILMNAVYLYKRPEAPFKNFFDSENIARISGLFTFGFLTWLFNLVLESFPTKDKLIYPIIFFISALVYYLIKYLITYGFVNATPQPPNIEEHLIKSSIDAEAVKIVYIDRRYYKLGFTNKVFFDKFYEMNKNIINLSSKRYDS